MPTGLFPAQSVAPQAKQKQQFPGSTNIVPFAKASKWHTEISNTQAGILSAAGPQQFIYPITSYGYLSALCITMTVTGFTGTSAVYFEDSPWSLLSQVMVTDVNGAPLHQLPGYASFIQSKLGGYRLFGSDTSTLTSVYNTPTSGNFTAQLWIFFEFGNDGLGCLPNTDNSARYNLQLNIPAAWGTGATLGPVFTTSPAGGTGSLAITVEALCRSLPLAQDSSGRANSTVPPAVGTVQYWTYQQYGPTVNSQNTVQLARVGNLIRNHVLIWRNTNGTRASAEGADVPGQFEFDWDALIRYYGNVSTFRQLFGRGVYGFDVPNGVLVFPNTTDPNKLALSEWGDEWMQTLGATKLQFKYTPTAGSGTLQILTNDFVPASAQAMRAPALQIAG